MSTPPPGTLSGSFRQKKWNLGEGLDEDDLNNAQEFMRSVLLDGAVRSDFAVDFADTITVPSVNRLFTGGAGAARATFPGSPALTISNFRGPIFFSQGGGYDGKSARILIPYFLADDELITTFDAADPSQDRYDLICLQASIIDDDAQYRDFEDTAGVKTSVNFNGTGGHGQLATRTAITRGGTGTVAAPTVNVVKGTPGGGLPSVPSGYVPWMFVKIAAAFSGSLDNTMVYDCRWPIGHGDYSVATYRDFFGAWTQDNTNGNITATGSSQVAYCYPQVAFGGGRLGGITYLAGTTGGGAFDGTVDLITVSWSSAGVISVSTVLENISSLTNARVLSDLAPVWTNGLRCPDVLYPSTRLALRFTSGSSSSWVAWAAFKINR